MLFAVGDIHGRFDLLTQLHKKIMEHSKQYDEIHTVVCLGDYIDRGPQIKEVVEFLRHEPFDGFKHVFLRGNHEDMLVKSLYTKSDFAVLDGNHFNIDRVRTIFIENGGDTTLESYGIRDLNKILSAPEEVAASFKQHLEWYTLLKPYYIANDYIFVHAGIMPGLPIEDQDENTMMWIRDRFLNAPDMHPYMIIHGHTPTVYRNLGLTAEIKPNRINVDTGAYDTGVLTAVCLDEAHILEPQFINTAQNI